MPSGAGNREPGTVNALVHADGLSKWYGQVSGLNNVTVSIPPGITGLLGPNGAGKSTFMKLMTGQLKPSQGTIRVLGQPIWGNPPVFSRIGFCPEQDAFYDRMTGLEWVTALVRLNGQSDAEADAAAKRAIERVDLLDAAGKKIGAYSKGMRQRIKMAQALVHDPDLLILDEPFSGLDPVNVELLKEIVLDLKRAGKTIIFSTHQMEVAEKICDDICLLNRSQKVFEGSLREIKRSFGRNSVAVRCEGGDGVLDDPALVSKLVRHADEAQALLAAGADAQVLLKRLIDSGAVIGKFEMVEPSLNDIFITKVTEPA